MMPQSSSERSPGSWSLPDEIQSVREEAMRRRGRMTRKLLKSAEVRAVVVGLQQGVVWPEHEAAGRVLIRVEHGNIELRRKGGTERFAAGMLIALEPGEPHDVRAVEDSAFLLIVGG